MQNILVVEDSLEAFQLIQRSLKNFVLTWARCIAEATLLANAAAFDLILLDVTLPDGNGFDFCEKLQASEFLRTVPVIMLTGLNSLDDKIRGFRIGCDQYITKPFNRLELQARVEALITKTQRLKTEPFVKAGSLAIDKNMQRVQVEGETVELTATEFKILMLLVQNQGNVLDRDTISSKVWTDEAISVRQVDTQISKLRKKIGQDKIESVHGVGYRFAA